MARLRSTSSSGFWPQNYTYTLDRRIDDLVTVIERLNLHDATLVAHDWGGAIAWGFAMAHPEKTDRLIILNLPHPNGMMRELANNPRQQKHPARSFPSRAVE